MATRMSSILGPSGYALVPLWAGADFTRYIGWLHATEQPSPRSFRGLEHEFSLAVEPLSNLMFGGTT